MKILSINANHTVDTNNVAFNVDAPPAAGVMEKIKYGKLSIRFENNLLHVRSGPNESPIDGTVVKNLASKIEEAENEVVSDKTQMELKHKQALEKLSKTTGLPIN